MKKFLVGTSLLSVILFTSPFANAATLTSMKKDEVMKAFSDKNFSTINAATLNGTVIDNNFTGYFSKDGKMKGKFKNKPDNSPQQDTGTWKVNDDGAMCFKWDNWDSNKERCVTLYRLKNGILVVNSDNGFETMILDKDMSSGDSLG